MKDKLCYFDEAYDMIDAEEIGWCKECRIKECPKNKYKKL
jgi:hypothetical protein